MYNTIACKYQPLMSVVGVTLTQDEEWDRAIFTKRQGQWKTGQGRASGKAGPVENRAFTFLCNN